MPYKSLKQERYFNANRGKMEAQGVNVSEWNSSSKGMKLPVKAKYDQAFYAGGAQPGDHRPDRKTIKTKTTKGIEATMAFGHPSQQSHMMAGVGAALKSKKTPAHLKKHLQARIAAAPPVPFGGMSSKKRQPALVSGDEPDTPTDANDDESMELEPSSPQPQMGVKPMQAASKKTPPLPSLRPKVKRPAYKMVKGNKLPSGFFG